MVSAEPGSFRNAFQMQSVWASLSSRLHIQKELVGLARFQMIPAKLSNGAETFSRLKLSSHRTIFSLGLKSKSLKDVFEFDIFSIVECKVVISAGFDASFFPQS